MQVKEQLRQSEDRYRELVEGIGDVLYATDENGVVTYISPSVRHLLGYGPEEVEGQNVRQFILPEDWPRQAENLSLLLSGGTTSSEYRLLARSGKVRWVRTSSQPIMTNGSVVGIRGMLADVTEGKLAEQRLERHNEFLNSVLESLPHPFYVVSAADYSVQMSNSAARRAGVTDGKCYTLTHGRDEPCSGAEHPCPLAEITRTGAPVTVEHVHRRSDGTERYEEVHAYPLFDAEHKLTAIIEYSLDATARRQADAALRESEAKLRTVFQMLPVGISILDRDRKVISENRALESILELSQEALHEGKHRARTYLRSDGTAMSPQEFPSSRAFAEQRMVQDEVGIVKEDGQVIWTEVSAVPVDLADWRLVLVTTDITRRKQAEEALRAAAVAAERSRLARDLHDSVTQALFSASLVAEVLPQVWQRDQDEALRGLDELRHLTHGALAEMRTLLLELRPGSLLNTRLDDLIAQLTQAITGRIGLAVSQELDPVPALPPDVQVTFYRVCQEALQNAVKHAAATRLTIRLAAAPSAAPAGGWRGQLRLEVADDGRAFNANDTRPDQLGLRIMRERAESIGALLTVESQPGRGTRVLLEWHAS